MENRELNLNEMEEIIGGRNEGGYESKPGKKKGCSIYHIAPGNRLGQIARDHQTTVEAIMAVNPELVNPNFIRSGCYIYIPR